MLISQLRVLRLYGLWSSAVVAMRWGVNHNVLTPHSVAYMLLLLHNHIARCATIGIYAIYGANLLGEAVELLYG